MNIEEGSSFHTRIFHAPAISFRLTGALTALALLGAIIAVFGTAAASLPTLAGIFMTAWLAISVAVTLLITPRCFVAGFLGGLLAMLVGWRVAGLHGVAWVTYPLLAAFAAFVLQFFDCVRADRQGGGNSLLGVADWHLTFIRIYIGFDMVPHFTEKLFAGSGPFMDDVRAFAGFGLPAPEFFVILGGLCELGIAIGIGMGLLTRLAAVGATLYFLIATIAGGHFGLGFIWASPGGGWEYPVLMMILYIGFAVRGGGAFSLDSLFISSGLVPAWLRMLMTPEAASPTKTA